MLDSNILPAYTMFLLNTAFATASIAVVYFLFCILGQRDLQSIACFVDVVIAKSLNLAVMSFVGGGCRWWCCLY